MDSLTAQLEELARALERAGAPGVDAARLLELASVATIKAVALDEVLDERPPRRRERPVLRDRRVELPVRRAA